MTTNFTLWENSPRTNRFLMQTVVIAQTLANLNLQYCQVVTCVAMKCHFIFNNSYNKLLMLSYLKVISLKIVKISFVFHKKTFAISILWSHFPALIFVASGYNLPTHYSIRPWSHSRLALDWSVWQHRNWQDIHPFHSQSFQTIIFPSYVTFGFEWNSKIWISCFYH